MVDCGQDRANAAIALQNTGPSISGTASIERPCPTALVDDYCDATDFAAWGKARNAEVETRNQLLQELLDAGCQWPQELEDEMLATDALFELVAESWPDPAPALARMFGTEPANNYLEDWVRINIELLTRVSCQIDRLGNLQGAQCEGARPRPPAVQKLKAWPWIAGALAVVGVALGVRLAR